MLFHPLEGPPHLKVKGWSVEVELPGAFRRPVSSTEVEAGSVQGRAEAGRTEVLHIQVQVLLHQTWLSSEPRWPRPPCPSRYCGSTRPIARYSRPGQSEGWPARGQFNRTLSSLFQLSGSNLKASNLTAVLDAQNRCHWFIETFLGSSSGFKNWS